MRALERSQQWPDRAILEVNKVILIARSLAARKRSFLEEGKWRRVHGPHEVHEKDYNSSLNDIFAKLPGIAETIQDIESSTVDLAQATDRFEVTNIKISNLIQELEDWYIKLHSQVWTCCARDPRGTKRRYCERHGGTSF